MGECHKSVDRIGKLLYDHHGCRVLPVDKEAGEGDNKVPRFCLRVPPGIVGKDLRLHGPGHRRAGTGPLWPAGGRELERTFEDFKWTFILSFIFMYIVLAAQYEHLVHPLTILIALPIAVPFGLLSLWLGGVRLHQGVRRFQ